MTPIIPASPCRQRGITLVVVLLLLVIVTLLGLAAMRGTIMQERMSGNVTSRGIAFQAAEATLRVAESWLRDSDPTMPASGCANGACAMPIDGAAPAWEAANFWTTGSGFREVASAARPSGVSAMRYVVESLGTGSTEAAASGPSECLNPDGDDAGCSGTGGDSEVRNFRITAFAQTENGARVLLQSTFQMP